MIGVNRRCSLLGGVLSSEGPHITGVTVIELVVLECVNMIIYYTYYMSVPVCMSSCTLVLVNEVVIHYIFYKFRQNRSKTVLPRSQQTASKSEGIQQLRLYISPSLHLPAPNRNKSAVFHAVSITLIQLWSSAFPLQGRLLNC